MVWEEGWYVRVGETTTEGGNRKEHIMIQLFVEYGDIKIFFNGTRIFKGSE